MTIPPQPFLRQHGDGSVVVDIHVVPNAARTMIQGLHDGALRVRLQALPIEGRANQALQDWLSRTLRIPRGSIELLRGDTSRRKQLRIAPDAVNRADWSCLDPHG